MLYYKNTEYLTVMVEFTLKVYLENKMIYTNKQLERRAVGELDHPESSVIAGDRISHNITETWWKTIHLWVKWKFL
jgi:hypothetical protein